MSEDNQNLKYLQRGGEFAISHSGTPSLDWTQSGAQ